MVYLYVEPLELITHRGPVGGGSRNIDASVNLSRYKRRISRRGKREGCIVRLVDVWTHVEMVPYFGEKCPEHWDTNNAVELAKTLYLNRYSTKEIFRLL